MLCQLSFDALRSRAHLPRLSLLTSRLTITIFVAEGVDNNEKWDFDKMIMQEIRDQRERAVKLEESLQRKDLREVRKK